MAVYRPKNKDGTLKSPYYYYDFKLKPVGQRRSRRFWGSTKQSTRIAAERVVKKIREEALLGRYMSYMTLTEACERYMREVGNHARTPAARRERASHMAKLPSYFAPGIRLVDITPDLVSQVAVTRGETWHGKPLRRAGAAPGRLPKAATVNRRLSALRALLRRAHKLWGVPIDLDQFFWTGPYGLMRVEPEGRVRALTGHEETRLFPCLDPDYRNLVELYIISGKRQQCWLALTKSMVDLDAGTVIMPNLKRDRPGFSHVQLTQRELQIVRTELELSPLGCPYVFTAHLKRARGARGRRPITARRLYANVKAAARKAGIEDLRPHDFRHTFATRAMRQEPNLKMLMLAMDHSSINSTLRYAHLDQREVKAVRSLVHVTRTDLVPEKVAEQADVAGLTC
jgi:integrase